MREFGKRSLLDITTKDARRFLAKLDREDISARTVNIHRQVLHAMFEFARREDSFGLPSNPFAGTSKRPEDGAKPIETFEPEEILAVGERLPGAALTATAAAMRTRTIRRRPSVSGDVMNEQDAGPLHDRGVTGLRLGEAGGRCAGATSTRAGAY